LEISLHPVPVAVLALIAAVLAAMATPLVARLASAFSFVDRPRDRHSHERDVPLLGGLAIGAAFSCTWLFGRFVFPQLFEVALADRYDGSAWLVAAASVVFLLGVVDDGIELGPAVKLAVQVTAASAVAVAGFGFEAITNPLSGGTIELGPIGPLLTIAWIVGVTNAFNLIDGLDGLAAGVGLIAAITLIGVAAMEGRSDAVLIWAILGGCLLGFLPYNFPPASIFLGDSGSLLIGFSMAVLSIQSLQKGATAVVLTVPVLALGLPLSDAAHALSRRWLGAGVTAVVRADRDHIHHRLMRTGISIRTAVLVLYASCLVFSALAFMAVVARGPLEALLVAVAGVAVFAATRWLGRARHESAE